MDLWRRAVHLDAAAAARRKMAEIDATIEEDTPAPVRVEAAPLFIAPEQKITVDLNAEGNALKAQLETERAKYSALLRQSNELSNEARGWSRHITAFLGAHPRPK